MEYQYFWWINTKAIDKHHFYAAGKYGQYLYLVPEQNLLFVRFGKTDSYGHWPEIFEIVAERLSRP